ncbi:hypothetical protein BGZ51_000699, partial [Haplosporangium sp. Z 767]
MVNPVIPTVSSNIASDELAKVLDTQDNSFEFYYFKMHTHGATPRALLAYGNAKWSAIYPDNWVEHDKPLTKFGTLPILYEISPDGTTVIEHAEAMAIEIRLARKFNLLGTNSFEESQILGFFSNTRAIMHRLEDAYFCRNALRTEERDNFIDNKLKQWIHTHEQALAKNGSNGHYVGNKVTLADIKTAVALDSLLSRQYKFKGFEMIQKMITKEATPNLWKVHETVQEKKSYKDWLESEQYKELTAETA